MILRRIIAHLRHVEWTAVAIDFVILVVGVFVGIQASNWNSARIDRELETEYIERIVADLDLITTTARYQAKFERNKSGQIVAALAMIARQPSDDKSLRLGDLLTTITIRLSPNFESPTFSDLQSSGRLSLIKDARLRTRLAAYFAYLQYLRAAVRLNNDTYVETFVTYLRGEAIGAGYADPALTKNITRSDIDSRLSAISRARFGLRDIHAHSSRLRLPLEDPFWERLRANLSWRGTGAIANETLLERIAAEASQMKREVERR